jgi:hypothetical protein
LACSLLRRPRSSCFSSPALWSTNTDPLIFSLSLSLSLSLSQRTVSLFLWTKPQNKHRLSKQPHANNRNIISELQNRCRHKHRRSSPKKTRSRNASANAVQNPPPTTKRREKRRNRKRERERERERESAVRRKLQQAGADGAATGYAGREPVKTCRNIGSKHKSPCRAFFYRRNFAKKRNIFY